MRCSVVACLLLLGVSASALLLYVFVNCVRCVLLRCLVVCGSSVYCVWLLVDLLVRWFVGFVSHFRLFCRFVAWGTLDVVLSYV